MRIFTKKTSEHEQPLRSVCEQSDSETRTVAAAPRRWFLKKALTGTGVLTASAGLMSTIIKPQTQYQHAYLEDIKAGNQVLKDREFTVMTQQEKDELLQQFVDGYKQHS